MLSILVKVQAVPLHLVLALWLTCPASDAQHVVG